MAHGTQTVTYFKRFRMEIDLLDALPPLRELPAGHFWQAWDERSLERHAEVKYQCFMEEVDAIVFPSLSSLEGCRNLMQAIRKKSGFCPQATWLLGAPDGYCGTVQGVGDKYGAGSIQNLGVTAAHRGKGLGSALLLKALHGFRQAGLQRAFLEVTAQNDGAIRLYRRLGFRCRKTIYKAVDALAVLHTPGISSWDATL